MSDAAKEPKKTKAGELADIISDQVRELFTDNQGVPYAAIWINGHIETLRINDSRFKRLVHKYYYEQTGNPIRSELVNQVCGLLEARASFDGNSRDLQLRCSYDKEGNIIYIDLTNKVWRMVRITKEGWSLEDSEDMPIMFKRYSNQMPQVEPVKEYPKDIFDQFMNLLNVKVEDHKILLKCYMVSLLLAHIPKPLLILHGEQNAAKSSCHEIIKDVTDPSILKTLVIPRDNNELIQQLSHNYIAYYDNISYLKEWQSDQFCRAVTGSGSSKRELFTDDDDVIYQFKRCIGLNGINLAASKADLLDRSIIILLERIEKENQIKIQEIFAKVKALKPMLLGYICDILVQVLKVVSEGGIKLNSRSRMADFEEYAEIISRCMGYPEGKFLEIYQENQRLQTEAVIEGSPVATVIMEIMSDSTRRERGYQGTATELLNLLSVTAVEMKINININAWPKAASALTRKLNELRTNLRQNGITIDYLRAGEKGERMISIRRMPSVPSGRQSGQNHAQNEAENTDGISDGIGGSQVSSVMSSVQIEQNHTQKQVTDDTDMTDGILRTSDTNTSTTALPYDYETLENAKSIIVMGFNGDWGIRKEFRDIWKCDFHKCGIKGKDKWYTIWHGLNTHVAEECKEKLGIIRGFSQEMQQQELRGFTKQQLRLLLHFVEKDSTLEKEILGITL